MAGNISSSNIWDPSDAAKARVKSAGCSRKWSTGLSRKEADIIVGETFYYAGEALAALEICPGLLACRIVLTLAPMAANEMMGWGKVLFETCQKLEQAGADVVGLNCFRGPQTMMPWLKKIRAAVSCHVRRRCLVPTALRRQEPTFFNLSVTRTAVPALRRTVGPFQLRLIRSTAIATESRCLCKRSLGSASVIRCICCGASPCIIRQVAEAVGLQTEASRYSENMKNHFMYGSHERLPEHIKGTWEKRLTLVHDLGKEADHEHTGRKAGRGPRYLC